MLTLFNGDIDPLHRLTLDSRSVKVKVPPVGRANVLPD